MCSVLYYVYEIQYWLSDLVVEGMGGEFLPERHEAV
jgi:hypothetical protein